jgi:hypothetical protein
MSKNELGSGVFPRTAAVPTSVLISSSSTVGGKVVSPGGVGIPIAIVKIAEDMQAPPPGAKGSGMQRVLKTVAVGMSPPLNERR